MIIVNSFQPLTIITKYSILDVAAALDRLWERNRLQPFDELCLKLLLAALMKFFY